MALCGSLWLSVALCGLLLQVRGRLQWLTIARLTLARPYNCRCEADYCRCVRADQLPNAQLQEAIAVAKVRAVETVIQLCFRLKQA